MIDYSDLFDMVRGGSSIAAAARKLGHNESAAQKACKRNGVKSPCSGGALPSPVLQEAVQYSVDRPDLTIKQIAARFGVNPKSLSQARVRAGHKRRIPVRDSKWDDYDWTKIEKIFNTMPLRQVAKRFNIPASELRRQATARGWARYKRPSQKAEPAVDLFVYFNNWYPPPGLKEYLAELRQ